MTKTKASSLDTLLDLLPMMEDMGQAEAVRFNNGYRTFVWTYARIVHSIAACAQYFDRLGLKAGQRILLWGENRPEWVVAFWAALVRGLQVVPVDPRASTRLVRTIQDQTEPGLLVYSENLDPEDIQLPGLRFYDIEHLPPAPGLNPISADPQDVVEIVFTSGTTGDPKGIVHTHANICADLRPLDKEIRSFGKYLPLLGSIRILCLLPLSHMFGQALGLFIPVLLKAAVIQVRELSPKRLMALLRQEKALALVTVPGQLAGLQNVLEAEHGCTRRMKDLPGFIGRIRRWIRFRDVHKRMGWKCLAIVVGGAQLRPSVEAWWSQLGFLVIQGYGLNEASPVVSLNNPLSIRKGSLGQVLEGQSVQIADDGEIWVRGPNVASYLGAEPQPEQGREWFPTGDIGRMDEEGNLYFLGRKKDVIVTRDGHNVFPEDVEPVLQDLSEVAACTVVGQDTQKGTEVHAVLILADQTARPESLVQAANAKLESHQRIRSWSLWPESDFPRTPSTGKVKRNQVAAYVNRGQEEQENRSSRSESPTSVDDILAAFTGLDPGSIQDRDRLGEDLGLSSLDRVELMTRLEHDLGLDLEEVETAVVTVGDLRELARPARPGPSSGFRPEPAGRSPVSGQTSPVPGALQKAEEHEPQGLLPMPARAQRLPFRLLRGAFQEVLLLPLFGIWIKVQVQGQSNLAALEPPVLFAANHSSHLDTLAILKALPRPWRRRVAPAMRQDFFTPLVHPADFGLLRRTLSRTLFTLLCYLLNAYPLPQQSTGVRKVLRFIGELVQMGNCPLIYPEGMRTPDGNIQPFQPGVGLMAQRLDLPVVPIRIQGLFDLFSIQHTIPRPGRASLTIGQPLYPVPDMEPRAWSGELQKRIQELGEAPSS